MDRKQRSELLKGRECRRAPVTGIELREGNGLLTLTGIASVTERSYSMGWYEETIKRGAFTKTLGENPDVQLLINHDGLPLARSSSGTLRLSEDSEGLRVEADLDATDPDVQRLAPKMRRGDVTEMSFAFRVVRQDWSADYDRRDIQEVDLSRGDVSVVSYGANPNTTVSLRNLSDGLRRLAEGDSLSGEVWRSLADEFGLPLDAIEKIEARMKAEPVTVEEPTPVTSTLPTTHIARAQALRLHGRR